VPQASGATRLLNFNSYVVRVNNSNADHGSDNGNTDKTDIADIAEISYRDKEYADNLDADLLVLMHRPPCRSGNDHLPLSAHQGLIGVCSWHHSASRKLGSDKSYMYVGRTPIGPHLVSRISSIESTPR